MNCEKTLSIHLRVASEILRSVFRASARRQGQIDPRRRDHGQRQRGSDESGAADQDWPDLQRGGDDTWRRLVTHDRVEGEGDRVGRVDSVAQSKC